MADRYTLDPLLGQGNQQASSPNTLVQEGPLGQAEGPRRYTLAEGLLQLAAQEPEDLGLMDALREGTWAKWVPVLGTLEEVSSLEQLHTAAKAIEVGKATPAQEAMLVAFAKRAQAKEGWGYMFGSIISNMPAWMGEFMMSGGILNILKGLGRAGAKKMVAGTLRETIEEILERRALTKLGSTAVKPLTTKAAAKAVGKRLPISAAEAGAQLGIMEAVPELARALGAPGGGRIRGQTYRAALPDMALGEDEFGEMALLFDSTVKDLLETLPEGVARMFAEVASERAGGALASLVGLRAVQASLTRRWVEKYLKRGGIKPGKASVEQTVKAFGAFKKSVGSKTGWNGILEEVLEERYATLLEAGMGLAEFNEVIPDWQQLTAELAAFSIPGAAFAAAGARQAEKDVPEGPFKRGQKVAWNDMGATVLSVDEEAETAILEPVTDRLIEGKDAFYTGGAVEVPLSEVQPIEAALAAEDTEGPGAASGAAEGVEEQAAPSQPTSPEEAVQRFSEAVGEELEVVEAAKVGKEAKEVVAGARRRGLDVQLVRGKKGPLKSPGALYGEGQAVLDVQAEGGLRRFAAHEMVHDVRAKSEETFKAVLARVRVIDPEGLKRHRAAYAERIKGVVEGDLTDELLDEEALAVYGESIAPLLAYAESEEGRAALESVRTEDPSLWQRFVEWLRSLVGRAPEDTRLADLAEALGVESTSEEAAEVALLLRRAFDQNLGLEARETAKPAPDTVTTREQAARTEAKVGRQTAKVQREAKAKEEEAKAEAKAQRAKEAKVRRQARAKVKKAGGPKREEPLAERPRRPAEIERGQDVAYAAPVGEWSGVGRGAPVVSVASREARSTQPNALRKTNPKSPYAQARFAVTLIEREVTTNKGRVASRVYGVSVPQRLAKGIKDKLAKRGTLTLAQARALNQHPERVADYEKIYASAERYDEWDKTLRGRAKGGKLVGVEVLMLTKGCGRALATVERVENGILPAETRTEACYGGDCWVNQTIPVKFRTLENMEVRDITFVDEAKLTGWLTPKRVDRLNKAPFIREGYSGDSSHLFATGIARTWLEAARNAGVKKRTVFISAGYAPVSDAQYAELAPYADLMEVHFSLSGWFHKNEIMLRLAEFQAARRAGIPATIRLISNPTEVGGVLMENTDFLLKQMEKIGVEQGEVLETPFHNDAIPATVRKKDPLRWRSAPLGAFENICCETHRCATCKYKCLTKKLPAQGAKTGASVQTTHEGFPDNVKAEKFAAPAAPGPTAAEEAVERYEAGEERFAAPLDSPEFRAWFGDSKVVDAEGRPLRVYHGTGTEFTTFARGALKRVGWGHGFHFAVSPHLAGKYADQWLATKPPDAVEPLGQPQIIPAYLSLQNPATEDVYSRALAEVEESLEEMAVDRSAWAGRYIAQVETRRRLEELGYDGIIYSDVVGAAAASGGESMTAYTAFRPEQIKSATGNVGTFDSTSPDIRYAAPTPGTAWEGWTIPAETTLQLVQRKVQDDLNRLKVISRAVVGQAGKELNEVEDAYLANELYHQRVADRIERFEREYQRPIALILKKGEGGAISLEEFHWYLYALHATHRNAMKRFEGQENPSGITDEQAEQVRSEVEADPRAPRFKAAAGLVHKLLDEKLDRQVAYGTISEDARAAYRREFGPEYVPLKTAGRGRTGVGRRFSVTGPINWRAKGRATEADNVFTQALADYHLAIIQGEKNRVAKRFLAFVRKYADPNQWDVYPHPSAAKRFLLDENGNPTPDDGKYTLGEREITVWEDGDRQVIAVQDDLLAQQLKNLDAPEISGLVRILARTNRFLSAMNTSWNPEFVFSNLARDLQTAGINLSGEQQAGFAKKVMGFRRLVAAFKGALRAARDPEAKGENAITIDGKKYSWEDLYRRYKAAGGKVGVFQMDPPAQQAQRIERFMAEVDPSPIKRARMLLLDSEHGLFKLIGDLNEAVENLTRLSTFAAALEDGQSEDRAGSLAKNLTVNFNRRGEWGVVANALYMFYNAGIQGSVRVFQALRHPKTQKIVAGIVVMATLLDFLNRSMAGDDDDGENFYDKIPQYIKERNLVVMLGDGDYVKLPLPWGFNVFWDLGTQIGATVHGGQDVRQSATNLVATAYASFNPIGGEATLLQTIAPTLADPLVQQAENQTFYGAPIKPENLPFGLQKPQSQLYWQSANPLAKDVTAWLNDVTGGDEVTAGAVDISPEIVEHYTDFVTGGAGRFLRRWQKVATLALSAEKVPLTDVPFARRLVGEADPNYVRRAFYEHVKEIEQVDLRVRELRDLKRGKDAADLRRAESSLYALRTSAKNARKRVKSLRDRGRDDVADRVMRQFNKRFGEVTSGA